MNSTIPTFSAPGVEAPEWHGEPIDSAGDTAREGGLLHRFLPKVNSKSIFFSCFTNIPLFNFSFFMFRPTIFMVSEGIVGRTTNIKFVEQTEE
jgi:hypothetical protein